MRLRGRGFAASAGLAIIAIAAAGCTSAEALPTSTPTPTPTYVSTYETPAPIVYAPLTGVVIDDPASLARPSLAAKIDNHPSARPQVGLETTDIVFEELVEGGLTRYVAVWHSTIPAEMGPVRSIRPMDPDIVSPLGGIIAYSGGQQKFVSLMRATEVHNAIHGQRDADPFMYRGKNAPAPHNVLVKAQELVASLADLAPPQQHFSFADSAANATAAREGSPVAGIDLRFGSSSTPAWRWDASAERWLRSQSGAIDVDATGAQLSAANVVVVRVPITTGLGLPKTELIGSGEAWVLSGGKAVHATWSKSDRSSIIRLVDDNGVVVRLAPGNSWIELVPNAGSADLVPAS
ncbi:DUF3048 domain-containing protein [Salinibacterium sp. ZJ70]|uniref:DUF3048 domain-containing protein n=1 Tax=Salinibacterium sp. ZJ70 TaxID=2708084 RepID=UPI00142309A0|nr:DUF3048 domain-containing protein [Salinibacterium sp. ZJ70]